MQELEQTAILFYKQIYISKEEIPVRGGECVLCYFSSHLNCIIGMSEPFKVAYTCLCLTSHRTETSQFNLLVSLSGPRIQGSDRGGADAREAERV